MLSLFTQCALADPEGIWATWQPWEECSQSCGGGTQSRSRQCVNFSDQSSADDSCIGGEMQSRGCNSFICPGNILVHFFPK